MNTTFTISDLYSRGWSHFKAHWPLAIGAIIITTAIQILLSSFGYQYNMETGAESGSAIISLISMIVTTALSVGMTDLFLSMSRGEESSINQLYKTVTFSKFFSYLFASLLFMTMFILGLILFIIPGIIVIIVFYPYYYFIIDNDDDAIKSLKRSREVTKGNRWKIFGLILTLIILNLLGTIALLIGLLVTIPLTIFIGVELYKALIGETGTKEIESEEVVVEDIQEPAVQ
jgi:uncharacterized membrane protein